MVQPQRASNSASAGGVTQRGLSSSSLSGMLQQRSQSQRWQHGSTSTNSHNSNAVLRIAMIICFLILLIYVLFYLSMFHMLFHYAKQQQQPSSPLLIRNKMKMNNNANDKIKDQLKDNLQIAVDAAKNIALLQDKVNHQPSEESINNKKEILILTTKIGEIRIVLRSDLSPESVSYVRQMATTPNACGRCNIYRAEKPGILQGVIASPTISIENIPRGNCPVGYEQVPNECPEWDNECNCHGPTMTKGMVGWAAGATGPDFFIDTYEREAKWWGTQHTVFGEIQDTESFNVIRTIYNTLPTHEQSGLTHLNEPLHFTLSLT